MSPSFKCKIEVCNYVHCCKMNSGSPMIFVIVEQDLCPLPFFSLKVVVFFLHDFLVMYRVSKRASGFQTLRPRDVFERDYHANHLSS